MSSSSPAGPFRERAVQQGENIREELDERVRVVGVPLWLALAIGVLVVVGFVAWAASEEVQRTIDGEGVAASTAGFSVVAAPVAGTVIQAPPSQETAVRAGDVLVRIDPGGGPTATVRARTAGTIASVSVASGSVVSSGQQLAALQPEGKPVALLLLPLDEAGQVEPGMKVLLSRTVEESQAAELLEGRVARVETTPATPASLELLLGPTLAAKLEQGQPVARLHVELVQDRAHDRSIGPIVPGSLLTGRVVLEQHSPLEYVF
jgi:multidrug resistance efflux pump